METVGLSLFWGIFGFIVGVVAAYFVFRAGKKDSTAFEVEIARLQERNRHLEDEKLSSEAIKEMLKTEFEGIANKALVENQNKLTETGKNTLKTLLEPVEKEFKEFKTKVESVNESQMKNSVELKTRIDGLKENNIKMIEQANELARALRQNQNIKGAYGESLLETVLNTAGLKENIQYITRTSFLVEGENQKQRLVPDIIVKLPQNRHVIIDSKMTLESYVEYVNEEEKDLKQKKCKKFKDELSKRVNELYEKDYTQIGEINSPDFILMYVPVESSLSLIYEDSDLIKSSLEKNVIIVGTSSLLTTMRIVNQLWLQDAQNKNAQMIAEKGASLYDLFAKLCEDLGSIAKSFDSVQSTFKTVINRFQRGENNIFRRVEELKELGVTPSKQIPQLLLEEVDMIEEAEDAAEEAMNSAS